MREQGDAHRNDDMASNGGGASRQLDGFSSSHDIHIHRVGRTEFRGCKGQRGQNMRWET